MEVVAGVYRLGWFVYDGATIEVNIEWFFAQFPSTAYETIEETYNVGHSGEALKTLTEFEPPLTASTNTTKKGVDSPSDYETLGGLFQRGGRFTMPLKA